MDTRYPSFPSDESAPGDTAAAGPAHKPEAAPGSAQAKVPRLAVEGEERGGDGLVGGAPPSNTAPQNYIGEDIARLYRWGIDSLYLSYPGTLDPNIRLRLDRLKELAQAETDAERALAQLPIGSHVFEVKAKGNQRFPYVLQDGCFHISVGRSKSLPLAYVQISSDYLAHAGIPAAVDALGFVVRSLGKIKEGVEEPNVSRADLFVDFSSSLAMNSWDHEAWVTRAHEIVPYYNRRQFTGWMIGRNGAIQSALYNKLLEIFRKNHKAYLLELWREAGWNGDCQVWRQEFRFHREGLKELGILTPSQLLGSLGGLWRYAMQNWLRLTIPNPEDENQTRWPTHPLWAGLAQVPWETEGPALKRFRNARLPGKERLFRAGIGYLSSFMAREGIEDFGEGLGEYLTQSRRYFDGEGRRRSKGFEGQLKEKLAVKARQYNTRRNVGYDRELSRLAKAQAEAYRKAREGNDADLEP